MSYYLYKVTSKYKYSDTELCSNGETHNVLGTDLMDVINYSTKEFSGEVLINVELLGEVETITDNANWNLM